MKTTRNCICGLIVVFILSVPALADPAYVALVDEPRQLGEGDDFPGMWEYVYDVVDTGPVTFIMSAGLRGFDGTLIANRWKTTGSTIDDVELWSGVGDPVEYQLHQKWDSIARTGIRRDPKVWYPSWWDGSQWQAPNSGAAGEAWAMDNQWHDGSVYNDFFMNFPLPGTVYDDGVSFGAYDTTFNTVGPVLTFRIVHPNAPTDIEYGIWHTGGADTVGTVVGPGSGVPGDLDGDGNVGIPDIDILADAIEAGSTDLTFDVNGDSVVDEQDLIHHIATLVERTGGVGTYRGDFNLDGYVDGTDLAILKAGFGLTGLGYAAGNCNADDFVNGTDLAIFKATFGFSGTPDEGGNPPAVPEPATLVVMACGAMGLLRRRRRREGVVRAAPSPTGKLGSPDCS